jgi:outer membrane protein
MKNSLKVLLIAVLVVSGTIAASAQELKFGHINSSSLLGIMPEREAAQKTLQNEAKSLGEELENLQVEYNNKLQKYVEEQDTLSNVVRQLRERELRELQMRIQEFQTGAQEDLQKRELELIQPIYEKITKVISEVARERGLIYVFDLDANAVLYFSDASEDILPFVKTKLGLQ